MDTKASTSRDAVRDLKIREIRAVPLSFRVPEGRVVRHGIGAAVKRDMVLVRVLTECGVVGWGEAHHGRGPTSIADLINHTLSHFVLGRSAASPVDAWNAVYARHIASHGQGAGTLIALSGIDMALWDARGRYHGMPCWQLMGGTDKPIPAYAGGITLGFQPAESLVQEVAGFVAQGFRAVKLRFGENVEVDLARLTAVRRAFPELTLMVDINSSYTLQDFRRAAPVLAEMRVYWVEEPFPAHDHRPYREARAMLHACPLAAGENHYGRFEFHRLLEDGSVGILQPDLSKSGGPTECLRIANMASAWKLPVCPHSSASPLNFFAAIHLLGSIDNGAWYEFDAAIDNPYRDELCSAKPVLDAEGCVRANDRPGWGVEVDETVAQRLFAIPGPGFI
jgi:D-galactarolactone cycloisomerase